MGEVVEIGADTEEFKIGDRVVCSTCIVCGKCKYCKTGREELCINVKGRIGIDRDGGFAEYARLPISIL